MAYKVTGSTTSVGKSDTYWGDILGNPSDSKTLNKYFNDFKVKVENELSAIKKLVASINIDSIKQLIEREKTERIQGVNTVDAKANNLDTRITDVQKYAETRNPDVDLVLAASQVNTRWKWVWDEKEKKIKRVNIVDVGDTEIATCINCTYWASVDDLIK